MTLTPPPNPLPAAWAKTIANSIATELRRGWRVDKATRAISPTGNPRTGLDKITSGHPKPMPGTEVLWSIPYAWALTDPIPALGVPYLLWHLTQTDLASALIDAELLEHAEAMQRWLRARPPRGPAPTPFTIRANRHGTLALRGNSEHAPEVVRSVLLAAVSVAWVVVPDPRDVDDRLAQFDEMRPALLFNVLSSPLGAGGGGALGVGVQ